MSRGGLSRRCWPPASGSSGSPPHRMGASRKGEREPGKSDEIDALAVARAVVKDGVEQFPVAYLNERAMEIRLLLDHREDLVAERTRTVNRLRWHLLELCPELERSLKRGALNQARVLDRVDRRLRKLPAGARVQGRARADRPAARPEPPDRRAPRRAGRAGQGAPPAAVGRARLRRADRGDPDRPHRRRQAIPQAAQASGCRPGPRRSPAPRASAPSTGSTAAGTASSTTRCTSSRSPAPNATPPPRSTSRAKRPKARPTRARCAASSATSPAASTGSSPSRPPTSSKPPTASRASSPSRRPRRAAGDPAASAPRASGRADHQGQAPFPMVCIS